MVADSTFYFFVELEDLAGLTENATLGIASWDEWCMHLEMCVYKNVLLSVLFYSTHALMHTERSPVFFSGLCNNIIPATLVLWVCWWEKWLRAVTCSTPCITEQVSFLCGYYCHKREERLVVRGTTLLHNPTIKESLHSNNNIYVECVHSGAVTRKNKPTAWANLYPVHNIICSYLFCTGAHEFINY